MALGAFFKTRLTMLHLHFQRDAIDSKNGEEQKEDISFHHQKNCKLLKKWPEKRKQVLVFNCRFANIRPLNISIECRVHFFLCPKCVMIDAHDEL